MISRFFQNFPVESQVSLCINVTQSNALTMKGTIACSGTSTRDSRPAAGPPSFLLLYRYWITSELDYVTSWMSHLARKLRPCSHIDRLRSVQVSSIHYETALCSDWIDLEPIAIVSGNNHYSHCSSDSISNRFNFLLSSRARAISRLLLGYNHD